MNNQTCERELEVPLGLDRIVYKTKRKPKPEPNYTRVQALLLLGMIVVVCIAGVII